MPTFQLLKWLESWVKLRHRWSFACCSLWWSVGEPAEQNSLTLMALGFVCTLTLSEPCLAASQRGRLRLNQFHRHHWVNCSHALAPFSWQRRCTWNHQDDSQCPQYVESRLTLPVLVSTLVAASGHVARSQTNWLVKVYANNTGCRLICTWAAAAVHLLLFHGPLNTA